MKKLVLFIIFILCVLSINAYASTGLTIQQLAIDEMISYGRYKDYAPPLGIAPSETENIDTMGGGLTRIETDLLLPGKNGLDLSIQRKYSSQKTEKRFISQANSTLTLDRVGYKYAYTDSNNTTNYFYIAFASEEDMLEKAPGTIYIDKDYIDYQYYIFRKVINGVRYCFYNTNIIAQSSTLTATRVASEPAYEFETTLSGVNFAEMDAYFKCYDLGCNWEILMPHIDISRAHITSQWATYDDEDSAVSELVLENGAVYSLYTFYSHFSNQPKYTFAANDIYVLNEGRLFEFEYDPYGDSNTTINGHTIAYDMIMTDTDSVKYYFSRSGVLQAKVDKYGNSIIYVPRTDDQRYIDYIIDSYGRIIQFNYNGKYVTGVEVWADNEMLNKIEYTRESVNNATVDPYNLLASDNNYILTVKKWDNSDFNDNEAIMTTYEHDRVPIYRQENASSLYYRSDTDYSYLLNTITYPTSLQTEYTYEEMQKYMFKTVSTMTVYKLTSRQDVDNNVIKNRQTYTYSKGSRLREGGSIPTDYNSSDIYTCVVSRPADGLIKTDHYSKRYKFTDTSTSANGYSYSEKYNYGDVSSGSSAYDDLKDIIVSTVKMYGGSSILGDSCYYVNNDYDIYGNLLSHSEGTHVEGLPDAIPKNDSTVTYEYDSRYNMLVCEKRQLNDTQWYKRVNTLSSDGKSITVTKEYEGTDDDNYTEKTSASYTYDSCGNIAAVASGNSNTTITHTYNSDATMTLTQSATGLVDADNVSIPNVTNITEYDALGRAVSVTDGNGNETEVSYDLLNRVTETYNPDGTETSAEYDTANNILTATDEGGRQIKLCYNGFGQLREAYIMVSNSWKKVEEYEYDALMRAIKATQINSYSGSAVLEKTVMEYEYYPFDMIKKVTKKDINGNIVTQDSYTYDFSSTSGEYLSDLPFKSGSMSRDNNITIRTHSHLVDSYGGLDHSQYDLAAFEKGLSGTTSTVVFDIPEGYTHLYGKANRSWDTWSYSATFSVYKNSETSPALSFLLQLSEEDPYTLVDLDISDYSTVKIKTVKSNSNYTYHTAFADSVFLTEHDYLNGPGENYVKVTRTSTPKDGITPPQSVVYYNRHGQAVKEKITDGSDTYITTRLYDKAGRLTEVRDSKAFDDNRAYSEKYEYDAIGNVIKEYNANGDHRTSTYDSLNRLTSQTDFMNNAATYTYDGLGRLIKTEAPVDTNVTSMIKSYYDGNGNITSAKTKTGTSSFRTETAAYDSMNRPVYVANGAGDGVQYTYDNLGNITRMYTGLFEPVDTSVTYDPVTSQYSMTAYTYDALGYLASETDALGNTEYYTNDISGKTLTKTDRKNTVTSYTYDSLSRKTGESAGNNAVLYSYDAFDNLTSVSGYYGTNSYQYDNFCRLTSETRDGYTKSYTYDRAGNRATMTLSGTNSTIQSASYGYDTMNRLATYTSGSVTASYTYNKNGKVVYAHRGANIDQYLYNAGGRVSRILLRNSGTVANVLQYTYYPDGNIATYNDNNISRTYTYDSAGRLQSEASDYGTKEYYYDLYGNREFYYDNGNDHYIISSYSYDKNNRLKSSEAYDLFGSPDPTYHTYTYDNNGNQLTDTVTEGNVTLSVATNTYDAFNRLISIARTANNVQTSASYTYDAFGMRQTKTVNNVTTRHIWDGSNIIADVGAGTSIYHRGIGLIAKQDGNTVQKYHLNAHGDVVMIGSSSYDYDAFGNQLAGISNDTNPFRYCGEYFDNETGRIYLRARYYAPDTGRFISEDPIRDGLNWYAYCGGNPVAFVDPNGKEQIVVSGSEYDTNRYKYNFIEPAIKKIAELKTSSGDEQVTWIVSTTGYSDDALSKFQVVADYFGVTLIKIGDSAQLQNYINSKSTSQWELSKHRVGDKITKFVLFSHGVEGSVELGYNQSNRDSLKLNNNWIAGIFSEAFNNPNSAFYSCNTGTGGDNSFAQKWVNLTGGKTWAAANNTTWYGNINEGESWWDKFDRLRWGFNPYGSRNYPSVSNGGSFSNFYKK